MYNEAKKKFDLEQRTLEFSNNVIDLVCILPKNQVNYVLNNQFLRSGTSIGANYREANETETKKDFRFRIRICKKEAKETVYWLQLLSKRNLEYTHTINPLIQESSELTKIFAAILRNYN